MDQGEMFMIYWQVTNPTLAQIISSNFTTSARQGNSTSDFFPLKLQTNEEIQAPL